ncbi:MAG: TRAP transporter small permease [Planctomycetes bacterium]|nr:TRAP transporter small permease [Planctomycetota bacterium]
MLTPKKFAGIYKAIDLIRKAAIVVLFAFIVGSMALEIAGRIGRLISEDFEPFWGSLEWTDEILRYVNIWVVFLGAGLAVKHCEHLHVSFLAEKLFGDNRRELVRQIRLAIVILFLAVIAVAGIAKTVRAAGSQAQMVPISIGWFYLAIPVGCLLMAMDYLLILLCGKHPFVDHSPEGESA